MAVFTRRSTNIGLLAVAVAGLAAASTGMALAAESRPSAQVEICMDEEEPPWDIKVTGLNQNGDQITETFTVDGCTILRKGETDYWWALGQDLQTQIGSHGANMKLHDDKKNDGKTVRFELHKQ